MFIHGRRKWEKAIKATLYGFVGIFIISVFFWYGGMGTKKNLPPTVIAKVGRSKITSQQFQAALEAQRRSGLWGENMSLEEEVFYRQLTFNSLVMDDQILEAARKKGMKASRNEVSLQIRKELDDLVDQRIKQDKAGFVRELNRAGLDVEGFKSKFAAGVDRRAVAEEIVRNKLRESVAGDVKVTDLQVKESFDEYEAPYIRVKIADKGAEAARSTAQQILDSVKSGMSFDQVKEKFGKSNPDVVVVASPGVQKRGSGGLPEGLEKAALALKVGEWCPQPIEAEGTFYVVKLAKSESKVPADFEQRKDFYRQQLQDRLKGKAWGDFVEGLQKSVKVEVFDKELDAYQKEQENKVDEAIASLNGALGYEYPDPEAQARIYYLLGVLWERKENTEKAIENYDLALGKGGSAPDVLLRIGELLKRQGKKDEALKRFQEAAEGAGASYLIHLRLQQAFQDLGAQELAQKEKAWLEENQPAK